MPEDVQLSGLLEPCPALQAPRVPLELVGIVVANRSTEMLVFSERERTREGLETVVERFEALQLGIAIQSAAIADIPFQTLGSTVRAYVDQQQPSP